MSVLGDNGPNAPREHNTLTETHWANRGPLASAVRGRAGKYNFAEEQTCGRSLLSFKSRARGGSVKGARDQVTGEDRHAADLGRNSFPLTAVTLNDGRATTRN